MLKNLPLKILSLVAAGVFWMFVVSLENTFLQLPEEVPVQVFNQAEDLALVGDLGGVQLTLRTENGVLLRNLRANDFEAYIDLRDVGVGQNRLPVSVTTRNSQVNVARVTPSEMDVRLEPVREKLVTLKLVVQGAPPRGFRVESSKLSRESVTISGAESVLKTIAEAKASVALDGTERSEVTKKPVIQFFNIEKQVVSGIKIVGEEPEVLISVTQSEVEKTVGVKPIFTGALVDQVLKKVSVEPAVLVITGSPEVLEKIETLDTPKIDLSGVNGSFERRVKVVLPAAVKLLVGQKAEVLVKVEVEKLSP